MFDIIQDIINTKGICGHFARFLYNRYNDTSFHFKLAIYEVVLYSQIYNISLKPQETVTVSQKNITIRKNLIERGEVYWDKKTILKAQINDNLYDLSMPGNGGNSDTVGGCTAEELLTPGTNLLDNPDFKINQRGKTIYDKIEYCVDRWRLFSLASKTTIGTVTPTNDGIHVVSGGVRADTYLIQTFDDSLFQFLCGKYVTVSFEVSDLEGSLLVSQYCTDDINNMIVVDSDGVYNHTFVFEKTQRNYSGILFYNNSNDISYTMKWIKLEIGTKPTPFVRPDPSLELLKCQRYCLVLTGDIARNYTMNSYEIYFKIATSVPMRVNPSIENSDKLRIKTYGTGNTADDFSFSSCLTKSTPNSLHITASKTDHGIPVGTGAVLCVNSGDRVILSAEML